MARPVSISRTIPIQKGQGLGQWVLMSTPRPMISTQRPMNVAPIRPPPRPQIVFAKERPLPEDKASDKNYWKHYRPKIPDRFGLGIQFKALGEGRLVVESLVEGGPAQQSQHDIRPKDLLHEIDRQVVFAQPTQAILAILESKRIGQPVYLGLHRVGVGLLEVKVVKGETGLRCGTGIVFRSDPGPERWVHAG